MVLARALPPVKKIVRHPKARAKKIVRYPGVYAKKIVPLRETDPPTRSR